MESWRSGWGIYCNDIVSSITPGNYNRNIKTMDTVEKGVANDPRPDAGLGRLESSTDGATTPSNKTAEINSDDIEAGSQESTNSE